MNLQAWLAIGVHNEPWLPFATGVLLTVSTDASEQEYCGPYNTILCLGFPPQTRYIVSPQVYRNTLKAEHRLGYVVRNRQRVVMIVDIYREDIFPFEYARIDADNHIRDCLHAIRGDVLSEVVGLSIFGRFCRVYRYIRTTSQITVNGILPQQWDIDLHTLQGRMQLATVFEDVRTRVDREL